MLQIFSDASTWENITFAATLILEGWNTQVVFFSKKYDSLASNTIGEIMGIEQGLQWVRENRPFDTSVEIYADNLSVAQKLCDYVEKRTFKHGAYQGLWLHIYRLCDLFDHIAVYHVPSHQTEHNPNKTCDILCSALLRPYKKAGRNQTCTQS